MTPAERAGEVTVILVDGPAAGLVMKLPAWPEEFTWPDESGSYEPVPGEQWPPFGRRAWGFRWAPARAGRAEALGEARG